MVDVLKHSNEEGYQIFLSGTESIEIKINNNQVFTQTVTVGNGAIVSFHIQEALEGELQLPA